MKICYLVTSKYRKSYSTLVKTKTQSDLENSNSVTCSVNHLTWRRQWHPTPVLLPGNSHGQRSMVGCNPWGRKESDTTERLHFHFSLSCTGEGNGNPLQCSCLENPMDRGAWWATVHGVARSWKCLKRLNTYTCMLPFWS